MYTVTRALVRTRECSGVTRRCPIGNFFFNETSTACSFRPPVNLGSSADGWKGGERVVRGRKRDWTHFSAGRTRCVLLYFYGCRTAQNNSRGKIIPKAVSRYGELKWLVDLALRPSHRSDAFFEPYGVYHGMNTIPRKYRRRSSTFALHPTTLTFEHITTYFGYKIVWTNPITII